MAINESKSSPNDLKITDNFDWEKELPKGKTLDSLTEEERKRILNRYRFSGYKPGAYQTITGIGNMS